MLEFALKYKEELKEQMLNTWINEKYWYYNCRSYFDQKELSDGTWNGMQFVSIKNGEVIGYLGYSVDRESRYVTHLEIVNFTDDITFGKDIMQMITDIFQRYNYRKIEFSVIIGNPIESKYDRLTLRYGGRIVGTYKEHVMLPDGKLYDEKLYEIFREDYLKRRAIVRVSAI